MAPPPWDGDPAALLRRGRLANAVDAARRARRTSSADAVAPALQEADALVGLGRARDALAVLARAMRRGSADEDLEARLRILRGHALWLSGRCRPGRREVEKGVGRALQPLTRARAAEILGLMAWKDQDLEAARVHLTSAWEIYEEAGSAEGQARVFEKQAGLLRDTGRLDEALEVQSRRVELAARTGRGDLVATAWAERGEVLAGLGRWLEARESLDRAAGLFREAGDPREITLAGVKRAYLDLARSDLGAAGVALIRAQKALGPDHGDPRAAGEVLLLLSDLHVAAGEPEAAERAAVEALGLYRLAGDRTGECRSRVRRTHALLGLDRLQEAVREARRAVKACGRQRGLGALAELTLGRSLLRTRKREACAAFDRTLTLSDAHTGLAHAARLGRALAGGAGPGSDEIRHALVALEMWGDRRLLSLSLADVAEVAGAMPFVGVVRSLPASEPAAHGEGEPWIEAALCLAGEGDWPERWAAAARAVRPLLAWHRAALVGGASWQLRGSEGVSRLPAGDVAAALAERGRGPALADLARDAAWRRDPTRVLHGLSSALVAPAGAAGVLYLDRREGERGFGEGDLARATQFGRLIARHAPPDPPEEAAPARFPEIVGRCEPMQRLFERMDRVAPSLLSVHVSGETGTGKERVARALHERSPRRGRAFVAVNASSLGDELFEAELFGHARGAFTGAVADRDGHVAAAQGGTLFIDEVADLTPRAQAKLLRFLADGEYRRVGETASRTADVRIVTAANAPLRARVAAGRFREDLMYRLTDFTLALPPLRDRGDDILLLARHFLRDAAAREGRAAPALPEAIAAALRRHAWPGNVRELQSEMKRLLVLAAGGPLRAAHLSTELVGAPEASRASLKDAASAWERDYLSRALARHGGSRTATALALGITRQALVNKIRRFGL